MNEIIKICHFILLYIYMYIILYKISVPNITLPGALKKARIILMKQKSSTRKILFYYCPNIFPLDPVKVVIDAHCLCIKSDYLYYRCIYTYL